MYFITYASRDGNKQQILANCVTAHHPMIWLHHMLKKWTDTVLVHHEPINEALYGPTIQMLACFDGLFMK